MSESYWCGTLPVAAWQFIDAGGGAHHRPRVGRAARNPSLSIDDRVGVAEAAVVRRREPRPRGPRSASPRIQSSGAWPSTITVGPRPLVHVSNPVDGPVQRPASGVHRRGGRLAVVEQPGRELQQDLRLGVAAHRAEHGAQRAVGGRHAPGTGCAAAGGRAGTRPDGRLAG